MNQGFEFTPTVKDVHSPAGQPFHAPRSFADMPDCPFCRYGTPVEYTDKWVCVDCGNRSTEKQIRHFSTLRTKQEIGIHHANSLEWHTR